MSVPSLTMLRHAKDAVAGVLLLGLLGAATAIVFHQSMTFIQSELDARLHDAVRVRSAIAQRVGPVVIITPSQSAVLEKELSLTPKQLLDRWEPLVKTASSRFGVPVSWIRAVIRQESGGRTVADDGQPITSVAGAMGVMQVMPQTYEAMRRAYGLGADPYDPHDNIVAGVAYMKWLYAKYGYPGLFAAYNDGPGNFDLHLSGKRDLPAETVAYVAGVTGEQAGGTLGMCKALGGRRDRHSMIMRLRLHCGAVGYREIESQLNG